MAARLTRPSKANPRYAQYRVLLGWPPLPNAAECNWLSALAIETSMPGHVVETQKRSAVWTFSWSVQVILFLLIEELLR